MAEQGTRTVERALNLLAIVCDRGLASLAEAARIADLSPSTALRLLRTLETGGFVQKDHDGNYRPGSRVMQIGAHALSNESLVEISQDMMSQLVDQTGESVYLSVRGHDSTALYISIHEGTHSVRHTSWVGRTVELTSSAAGRVLLGQTPPEGYISVERGIEPDVTAIAAPIVSEGRVVAALSLVVPSYRVNESQAAEYGRFLRIAAQHISDML